MQLLGAPRTEHVFREQSRASDALASAGVYQGNFGESKFLKVPLMCVRLLVGTTFAGKVNLKTFSS